MFINISNHPPEIWGDKQKIGAWAKGVIRHIPFPNVPPGATTDDVAKIAKQIYDDVNKILKEFKIPLKEDFSYCLQGEFSLCYALKPLLDEMGGHCYVPTTERGSERIPRLDGTTRKRQVLKFVQWREAPVC